MQASWLLRHQIDHEDADAGRKITLDIAGERVSLGRPVFVRRADQLDGTGQNERAVPLVEDIDLYDFVGRLEGKTRVGGRTVATAAASSLGESSDVTGSLGGSALAVLTTAASASYRQRTSGEANQPAGRTRFK